MSCVLCLGCWAGCAAQDQVLPFTGPAAGRDGGVADAGRITDGGRGEDARLPEAGPVEAGWASDAAKDAAVRDLPADPECDMTGLWMAKQLTRSEALALGQFANYWYFFELAQSGDVVRVVSQLDCDIRVEGSVTVRITTATRRALMAHNRQTTRRGRMRRLDADHCELAFERFWSVRGADEARFAPDPRSSAETVAELQARLPLPSSERSDGAEDWDEDGLLGIAWQIRGIASGTRNTVQRDVTEWLSDEAHAVPPGRDFAAPFVLRTRFDNDENVLHATSSLVGSLAVADQTAAHRITFAFLGRDASDPRAQAVLDADPLVLCDRVVAALPYESSL